MAKPKQDPKNNAEPGQLSGSRLRIVKCALITLAVLVIIAMILPLVFELSIQYYQQSPQIGPLQQFPVTVDPKDKMITENAAVNEYLEGPNSPLEASAAEASNPLLSIVKSVALKIAEIPGYQNLASVAGIHGQLVTVNPGLRKEQVAALFGKSLSWNNAQQKEFIAPGKNSSLPLAEGSFFPGTYFVKDGMTPSSVQALVNQRFTENVLAHYSTSTAQIVPLGEALTIASIIQRETIGNDDMRLISGILWNRLFANMNLQVDATLQYAKANTPATQEWWPSVVPKDKYIKSPYNTYLHPGLPPTPIANPSVAAILAALNPIQTPCLYYFSDKDGNFHCSTTYAEHVALLKKYYGN